MSNVLVVGSGGREHALSYGIAASADVKKVFVSPGNAGTAQLNKAENVILTPAQLPIFCKDNSIDFVVIGPDAEIVAGLGDDLRAAGITVFAPSKAAAQLEGSKGFATEFMQRKNISMPPSKVVQSRQDAEAAIKAFGGPSEAVIKADGLAAGKGVFLPDNDTEAAAALDKILSGDIDGRGDQLVIQQRYHGPEVSVFVLSDGQNFKIIPIPSQDHKRLLEGDKGPNTGGMGVYAPLPGWIINDQQWAKIATIAEQTIRGMVDDGTPYESVLYIGLMLAQELDGDPIVIEYNSRWGDPETEVLVPMLMEHGVDIYRMLRNTADGKLDDVDLPHLINGAAMTTCLAVPGYPSAPVKGQTIYGLEDSYPNVVVFHAGTKKDGDSYVTNGGRVLFVTGLGVSLAQAQAAANEAIGEQGIHFENMQRRTDIGWQALQPGDNAS